MKNLIMIRGAIGVGKTAVSRILRDRLPRAVFLDGDWCWDMSPFVVNDETKAMVMDNIIHLLNNFLACSAYENVIFCWVMHQQAIQDQVLAGLNLAGHRVHCFSLVCSEAALEARIRGDVARGLRDEGTLARSLPRLSLYRAMGGHIIETDGMTPEEVAARIQQDLNQGVKNGEVDCPHGRYD